MSWHARKFNFSQCNLVGSNSCILGYVLSEICVLFIVVFYFEASLFFCLFQRHKSDFQICQSYIIWLPIALTQSLISSRVCPSSNLKHLLSWWSIAWKALRTSAHWFLAGKNKFWLIRSWFLNILTFHEKFLCKNEVSPENLKAFF